MSIATLPFQVPTPPRQIQMAYTPALPVCQQASGAYAPQMCTHSKGAHFLPLIYLMLAHFLAQPEEHRKVGLNSLCPHNMHLSYWQTPRGLEGRDRKT